MRDFAQVKGNGLIDLEITKYALDNLNIDSLGLDEMDNKILCTIIDKFQGGTAIANKMLNTANIKSALMCDNPSSSSL